jgi:DNA-binding response OmpR family regulator
VILNFQLIEKPDGFGFCQLGSSIRWKFFNLTKGESMNRKILIVDDEAHLRMLIEQTLEDLQDKGVELLTAGNGEEALETIKAEKPNLVFLDVMMPKMSGFDVCHAVKNELGMKDVHIVLLTAKGQEFDKQKGQEAGANLYMTKPFDPDALLAKAKEVLGISN